ncbi:hypothetical protein M8C21_033224 [Ambrosia artemisiifolia]|uniref:Uncharacterized protein n=1 Tax=Ambrosia artemisiifolia TaxID=4212 RepID=A0AAD5BVK9_AMBAR|nr:hypothetical protein M8C21_033224 [Ambrosia artemisiifolia]
MLLRLASRRIWTPPVGFSANNPWLTTGFDFLMWNQNLITSFSGATSVSRSVKWQHNSTRNAGFVSGSGNVR